jgi:hypothetical protein
MVSVTRANVWIGDRMYWTLTLVATNNCDTLSELHTPKVIVTTVFTSRCLAATFNAGCSLSPGFPNSPRPRVPAAHFSQQQFSTDNSKSESVLHCNWPFTANRFVLTPSLLRFTTKFLFQLNSYGHSPYVTSSLMIGCVFIPYEYASPLSSVRIAHTSIACY